MTNMKNLHDNISWKASKEKKMSISQIIVLPDGMSDKN
jgi:hypothetical protein